MKTYDCFLVCDEDPLLLEIRFAELRDSVDVFVAVESDRTFSNKRRQITFDPTRYRHLVKPGTKIRHIVVGDMPDGDDPWRREHHQRNAVIRGLHDAEPDDLVMVSDVDEIPNQWCADLAKGAQVAVAFKQRFYYYWLNCKCLDKVGWWIGTRAIRYDKFLMLGGQGLRESNDMMLPDAGWHFSYMGGVDAIRKKIASYSHHREFDNEKFSNRKAVLGCVMAGDDLFGREHMKFEFVGLCGLPDYVLDNFERYDPWFRRRCDG